ncbi:hypothetical protein [Nocardia crassostreae]|uniref:hypothetical protein n=1 Tax=Nocardia crassostreae TaxID=53428 RepID=UPI000AC37E93|nr:hypothetical protein [Nocardia crassostreae]
MTYPPGPPSGPGFGGDPNAHGQQPEPDAAWWEGPATPPAAQPVWPAPEQGGWQGQPVQGAWPGQPGQPDWAAQQGYPQQGYPQQPGYPPPQPRKSNTGMIVGIAVGVVALLAVAVGAIVVFTGGDDSGRTTVASATTTTTSSAPTTTRRTTTTTTKAAPAGGHFSYTEYSGAWNFRLGDVALQADWVTGNDYSDCAPVEETGKLTSLGCQYSAELVWQAEGGALMLTQYVLGMGDAAKASGAEGQFDDKDIRLNPGSYIADWETGKWRDGSEKEFLVITFATATAAVDADTVEKYLRYRHQDTVGALMFR